MGQWGAWVGQMRGGGGGGGGGRIHVLIKGACVHVWAGASLRVCTFSVQFVEVWVPLSRMYQPSFPGPCAVRLLRLSCWTRDRVPSASPRSLPALPASPTGPYHPGLDDSLLTASVTLPVPGRSSARVTPAEARVWWTLCSRCNAVWCFILIRTGAHDFPEYKLCC